jgi:CheY-like chemotaxis protein
MIPHEGAVLIVDDDLDIRETLTEILEDRGFAVITAANGLEALQVLRSADVKPSVILLDLMMPVMDGYDFLAEYKRDPALASIPVVVVTAGHRVDRSLLGSAALVPKPIDVPRLVRLLQGLRSAAGTS